MVTRGCPGLIVFSTSLFVIKYMVQRKKCQHLTGITTGQGWQSPEGLLSRHGFEQYSEDLADRFNGINLDRTIPDIAETLYCLMPSVNRPCDSIVVTQSFRILIGMHSNSIQPSYSWNCFIYIIPKYEESYVTHTLLSLAYILNRFLMMKLCEVSAFYQVSRLANINKYWVTQKKPISRKCGLQLT